MYLSKIEKKTHTKDLKNQSVSHVAFLFTGRVTLDRPTQNPDPTVCA